MKEKYTAVIIDDEKPARDRLRNILNKHFKTIKLIGEGSSVATGIKAIETLKPNLVFLDIKLFDGSGFNVLEHFNSIDFRIIFVTAYDRFAIKAFRVNALDYILKPINIEELGEALEKLELFAQNWYPDEASSISQNWSNKIKENQKLAIRESEGIRYVLISDIVRCQSHGNYSEIHLANCDKIMTSRTLMDYTKILAEFGFFRIYQSHLVNLTCVKKIITKGGLYVELESGEVLELSRRKRTQLILEMEALEMR